MSVSLTDLFADVEYLVSGRMYPGGLPDGVTFPAIAYNVISGREMRNLSGVSGKDNLQVQLDIFAEDYSDADQLRTDLIDTMNESLSLTTLQNDLRSTFAPEQNLHRISIDISVWDK